MESFLRSEQFATYRKMLLEEIANFINSRLFGSEEDLRELRGALEISRMIIRIPLKIKREEFVKEMIHTDLESFKADFVRKSLEKSIVKSEVK